MLTWTWSSLPLPHGHSQAIAPAILDRGIPFVDLGADFRLDDASTYERWYGDAHEAPDLLGRLRLRHSGAEPRGNPWRESGGRRRLLRHGRDPRVEALGGQRTRQSEEPDRRRRLRRQRRGTRGEGSDRLQHGRRQLRRLRPAQPPPYGRNGNGVGSDRAVHASPRPDDPRDPRDLLRRGHRQRRSAARRCARPMPTSRSCTSRTHRPRPSG